MTIRYYLITFLAIILMSCIHNTNGNNISGDSVASEQCEQGRTLYPRNNDVTSVEPIVNTQQLNVDSLVQILYHEFGFANCDSLGYGTLVNLGREKLLPLQILEANGVVFDGLSSALHQLKGKPFNKSSFALLSAFMLYGIDESVAEEAPSILFEFAKNSPEMFQEIRPWLKELPKEKSYELVDKMAYYLVIEVGSNDLIEPLLTENGGIKIDYNGIYKYIATKWPLFIHLINDIGINFEPHDDCIQIETAEFMF
ncbi:MAG: hypothetical protein NC418_06295 [Muribaculaceae bacterium]|nr:hypothetical protein [Muribaculaceae bacterium]